MKKICCQELKNNNIEVSTKKHYNYIVELITPRNEGAGRNTLKGTTLTNGIRNRAIGNFFIG